MNIREPSNDSKVHPKMDLKIGPQNGPQSEPKIGSQNGPQNGP